ncbi:MAG: hypothetical protein U5N26_05780 [Candidatus Marinimicrobia bacterium]|nr:hypothetical protein [Candidatus Neomarinimicrobiota bacterium]
MKEELEEQQAILEESLKNRPEFLMKIYREYFPYERIPLEYFSDYTIISIRANEAERSPGVYRYFPPAADSITVAAEASSRYGDSTLTLTPCKASCVP